MISKQTDFEIELAGMDSGIAELDGDALQLPVDRAKVTKLAY